MKDVQGTLKRIDDQIIGHQQQIARSRVEISRLQETRLVLMGLAEEDAGLAAYGKEERQGVINGSHAKPVLIVRKVGTGDEEGSASKAAKEGLPVNKNGNRRGMGPKKSSPKGHGSHKKYKDQIESVLRKNSHSQFSVDAIIDKLGIGPTHGKARQPIYQALYELQRDKVVHRPNGVGSYQLSP